MVPIPFIARVQGVACDRMAGQLRTFFSGADDTLDADAKYRPASSK